MADLDKFTLQTYLNELAPNFSQSVLAKTGVYLNAILGEAVELEFVPKNLAAKLLVPRSGKKAANQPLTPQQIPQVLFHLGDRDRLIVRMFLVLGLRPGECLRCDGTTSKVTACVSTAPSWMASRLKPRPTAAMQRCGSQSPSKRSSNSGAQSARTFLFRVLKEAGKRAQIKGVTHQMLRRTCSTYMAQLTTVKDVQAHLRHSSSATTLEHYIKSVPESVRVAVESLDHLLKKAPPDSGQPAN